MTVRFASLDLDPSELARRAETLTEAELDGARRLERPLDRDRAVARRAILRELVADELGLEPDEVPLRVSPAGRPELADDLPLELSVSSSGGMGVFAFGPRLERLGVAIEASERRELALLDPAVFLDDEELGLVPDDEPDRARWLLSAWTLKTAIAAALGGELALPLRDLHVGDVGRPQPRLRGDWRRFGAAELGVQSVGGAPEGFAVALAVARGA